MLMSEVQTSSVLDVVSKAEVSTKEQNAGQKCSGTSVSLRNDADTSSTCGSSPDKTSGGCRQVEIYPSSQAALHPPSHAAESVGLIRQWGLSSHHRPRRVRVLNLIPLKGRAGKRKWGFQTFPKIVKSVRNVHKGLEREVLSDFKNPASTGSDHVGDEEARFQGSKHNGGSPLMPATSVCDRSGEISPDLSHTDVSGVDMCPQDGVDAHTSSQAENLPSTLDTPLSNGSSVAGNGQIAVTMKGNPKESNIDSRRH